MLDTSRGFRLGPVSTGAVVMDTFRGLDLAFERAVGLGALSLWTMVIFAGHRLGMDTGVRLDLSRIRLQGLPLASRACFFLEQSDSSRQLRWLVPPGARRALAQA